MRRARTGAQAVELHFCPAHAAVDAAPVEPVNPEWGRLAEKAVERLARKLSDFTTDDVWEALAGVEGPGEPRAISAVMSNAAGRGLIAKTSKHRVSIRPECHRRPVRVWRSLVCSHDLKSRRRSGLS